MFEKLNDLVGCSVFRVYLAELSSIASKKPVIVIVRAESLRCVGIVIW